MASTSRICMNTYCGAPATANNNNTSLSNSNKKGWLLKSGQHADLCSNCGSIYENSLFCDTFHVQETGWRECSLCNKRLHCGCSASRPFIEIQDFGGVWCITCAHTAASTSASASHMAIRNGISAGHQSSKNYTTTSTCHLQNTLVNTRLDTGNVTDQNLLTLGGNVLENKFQPDLTNASCMQVKPEANSSVGVVDWAFPNLSHTLNGPTPTLCEDNTKTGVKDMREPQVPSLNISLHPPAETSNFALSFSTGLDGDQGRSTLFQSGQRPRQIFPKPPKASPAKGYDANKSSFSPMRAARPPAEGRLRSQLLQRYWPRITDQELQKLSGDLNSTIVPLFEKILSASDASRIGRLVLPKACAEAYFPPINQSEGLPINIQDVKGNEWTFQFRFWPNNNSRMYVLEGVTPCIQSMQLQAGDTVTFSRIDPGGKLVIGYRKASTAIEMQDAQPSLATANAAVSGESFSAHVTDGPSPGNAHIGPQPTGGDKDNIPVVLTEQTETVIGDTVCEKPKCVVTEDALQQPKLTPDKKKTKNISSKSKRLLMHGEDAVELRISWEETQDLLRPPPTVKPNVVKVEDFEFEEYSDPPVFGKRTYFASRFSGVQEQWAQCDKCSKWRKLPADVLLSPKWFCSENVWDLSRASCTAPEEVNSKELEIVFRSSKEFKKRKGAESVEFGEGCEPSGLDALATAATLGDHEETAVGATTRHPRHRPGCTCIVCIQPPSGKGKHKPSCVCNVCLTVKRRFKTLMMRKKKRQCEQEAEMGQQNSHDRPPKRLRFMKNASPDDVILDKDLLEDEVQEKFDAEGDSADGESSSNGHIDLNCHPTREEDPKVFAQPSSATMNLAQIAGDPLVMCINSNGSANSVMKQQTEGKESSVEQADGCGEHPLSPKDDCYTSTVKVEVKVQEHEEGDDEDAKKPISE